MSYLSVLVKPVSGTCNMNCTYCFYHDEMKNRTTKNYGYMKENILEEIVKKAFLLTHSNVDFIFQGGEPMMIGLDFYKQFITYVNTYNVDLNPVSFSIQTNGSYMTKEFAIFLKQNNFLVGISIDGSKRVHDNNRIYSTSSGTYEDVIKGLHLLQEHEIDFNILSVVTNYSTTLVKETYESLKDIGTDYLQFIPCLDPLNPNDNSFLSSKNYELFLKQLFDLWYKDFINGRRISIRYFDDIVKILLGFQADSCTLQGSCINQNVIESDGSVFPCDFYVLDEWYMGNIITSTFEELNTTRTSNNFINSSREIHEDCINCEFYSLCKGGCRRNKDQFKLESASKTKYCNAFKSFFAYSLPRFLEIRDIIISQ